ncbi:MAG: KH domain-containing protein [Candidatus Woesearchaeota archaeon]
MKPQKKVSMQGKPTHIVSSSKRATAQRLQKSIVPSGSQPEQGQSLMQTQASLPATAPGASAPAQTKIKARKSQSPRQSNSPGQGNTLAPPANPAELSVFSFSLKIPKERIAVVIGKQGQEKKQLETQLNVNLKIDSQEGDIEITATDGLLLFTAKEVIHAIGRGFNPDIALQLTKQDFGFEQISLNDYVRGKNHLVRIRSRIIGREGKARENIEQLTETNISIYGKTICVIGRIDQVLLAKQAIVSLIQGSPHANVYKWLEKRRRQFKEAELAQHTERFLE